ncbi:unnamed protein product, partial [Didymodactylos carnosus]
CTTELPITLKFLHTGSVFHVPIESLQFADNFCLFWLVYNYILNVTGLFLITYTTIERYLLIFYRTMFIKKMNLFLFHYVPILFSIIYPLLFYIGVILIYPCENHFSYTSFVCGQPCYQFNLIPTLVECFLNLLTPVCITTIINLLIIVRILIQKHRMKQASTWNKNKKMVIQLLWISILYIFTWVPLTISLLLSNFDSTTTPWLTSIIVDYLNYLTYLAGLLCPFVCIMALSEVRKKIMIVYRTTYFYRIIQQQRVGPSLTRDIATAITVNGGDDERSDGGMTVMMMKPMMATVVATVGGGGNFVRPTQTDG